MTGPAATFEGVGAIDDAGVRVADAALLRACVHCGLCLNACPTYVESGMEADSPRGRLYLIRGLEEGTLALSDDVVRHLDLCLGCRGCETACPSGVRYGSIIEEARAYVERHYPRPWWDRLRRRALLAVFPYPARLRAVLRAAELARAAGIWSVVERAIGSAALIPPTSGAGNLPPRTAARGAERARVGLLTGCVNRELFAGTNAASVRVLARNGVTVLVPPGQGCCGALHLHSGDPEAARELARRNLDVFLPDLDAVVVTAAGCGAAMKEYGRLLADDPVYAPRARRFAERVRDVTEFLAALPVQAPERPLAMTATYHDACHLAHGQGVRDAPRQLLARIPGLELVELPESDLCCGSAGSYNLTEPEMAERLRERKVANIAGTGARCVVAANPGCSLQIQAGLRARGLDVRVAHPVELLDEAYEA